MRKLNWQKSSFSGDAAECVEIASDGELIRVRESDEPAITITTTKAKLTAWLQAAKAGEFDHLTH
ncbi:protein of unknown function [Streptomyces sp. TLI_053]|uniref:DUF397 domain-containing protein n=1 Tax=Streptomyces sp. TLI_053 TaxID=1855352 RepID=UPI00087CAE5F|nr:DUF397 domain-containing protein [Streptomyces sp. TLI_053]SDT67368.1 protein of unknown function [Streptomyces sp. TLI_053]